MEDGRETRRLLTRGEVVIRFKCVYCGQRILASEEGRGKKGTCPKCKHNLFVPESTVNRPAIDPDKAPLIDNPVLLQKEQIQKIPDKAGYSMPTPPEELTEIYAEKLGFLVPNYDELTLFLMAATFILLCFTNNTMLNDITGFLTRLNTWRRNIYIALFLTGMFMCLYHVFTKRKKTDFEKAIMLLFAVTINAATGIIAGIYMIKESPGWLLVFPIWNIINGVLLILMLRFNIIDENCIADRNATAGQVTLGLISVLILFILCNFIFKLHWAITFSICIVYATSFDRALQTVFPRLAESEEEQIP